MKKVLDTKKREYRRPSEPVFWDSVEKSEEEEKDATFSGLKQEKYNFKES